ncbi:hypothetical protein HG535_0E03700 [Zygotorulaspora mrakii]|uniref:Actin interacting protein 3 C-terminal domain-containing protein n=1 Tax=Zygotorulaspora mrakii TaxID=42260 RepID=A0A7H9B4I9_ZYGMR|nr:uncharacterized protein HG535_0E03700 [Zygotorulaspora mrakii]QLG73286.1 hypothetical protein HG535_0E03700 [Zygotorulaspora mrakii]
MSNAQEGSAPSNGLLNGSSQRRPSSGSSKSAASSVETTITKLLMSTKQLLQTLTQWSRRSVNEKMVSDAYVQLGNDFKVVSKVFSHCGVDVSDLGDVPMDLRRVLEAALREKPSDDNLNKYLPTIREIIVTLLDKLKVKQALLKSIKQDQMMRKSQHQQRPSVVSSLSLSSVSSPIVKVATETAIPSQKPVTPSFAAVDNNSGVQNEPKERFLSPNPQNQVRTLSEDEALSQLKKSSNLQRRASKRFSAYHMAKLTNQSTTEAAAAAALASGPSLSASIPTSIPLSVATAQGFSRNDSRSPGSNKEIASTKFSDPKESSEVTAYTLFLKMNGRVKKCIVAKPLNINVLRLLFVEKFAYSPGKNSFPHMYMKDPAYSVYYELDDQGINEVCSGSIIELREKGGNNPMTDFSGIIEAFKKEVSKSQEDILNHISLLNDKCQKFQLPSTFEKQSQVSSESNSKPFNVVEVKQELSKLRQVQNENKKLVNSTLATVLAKLSEFRNASLESPNSCSKTYIEKSQNKLSEVSDGLLSRVDDLQDLVEILRKDVANRGARPSKKKLQSLLKELTSAQDGVKKMEEYIGTEKPRWKAIWEKELDKVCEEQQFLTLQEDLAIDLAEDVGKALETFSLVNLCCVEQEKNPERGKSNPILPIPRPGELKVAREQLLMDVQSLHPDHEGRKEALAKAEKLWEKERKYRDNDEFEDELETFVGNASFKRSGGVEEVERLRQEKDKENLRANFGPPIF